MKTKCIIAGCGRPQYSRGLCRGCYQAFQAAIKANKVTDEAAVNAGLALAPHSAGRKPSSPFMLALSKLKEEGQ